MKLNPSRRIVLSVITILAVGSVTVLAQAGRKTGRTTGDMRDHQSEFALGKYLPYEGLGTVDLLDDGTLAIELGGTRWVDDEPVQEGTSDMFLFDLNSTGVSLIQHNGEYFIDVDGGELAARSLDARRVVRTVLPERKNVDISSQRYAVYSETGTLRVNVTADAVMTVTVEDEDTGGRLFSFLGILILDSVAAPQFASGGYPGTAQPAGPQPGSNCHATCPGGRSCDINCGTEGCQAWCRGKEPKCMCLSN